MLTQEEIDSLLKATQTITKGLNKAINSENINERVIIAMMLVPLLPTIDEFMTVIKEELNHIEEEKSSSEDQIDNSLYQVAPNGTPS